MRFEGYIPAILMLVKILVGCTRGDGNQSLYNDATMPEGEFLIEAKTPKTPTIFVKVAAVDSLYSCVTTENNILIDGGRTEPVYQWYRNGTLIPEEHEAQFLGSKDIITGGNILQCSVYFKSRMLHKRRTLTSKLSDPVTVITTPPEKPSHTAIQIKPYALVADGFSMFKCIPTGGKSYDTDFLFYRVRWFVNGEVVENQEGFSYDPGATLPKNSVVTCRAWSYIISAVGEIVQSLSFEESEPMIITDTAPTLVINPSTVQVAEGENLADKVNISYFDYDNDTLTFSCANCPSGVSVHATTGVLSGSFGYTTTRKNEVATVVITVTATGAEKSTSTNVTFWVSNTSVITGNPNCSTLNNAAFMTDTGFNEVTLPACSGVTSQAGAVTYSVHPSSGCNSLTSLQNSNPTKITLPTTADSCSLYVRAIDESNDTSAIGGPFQFKTFTWHGTSNNDIMTDNETSGQCTVSSTMNLGTTNSSHLRTGSQAGEYASVITWTTLSTGASHTALNSFCTATTPNIHSSLTCSGSFWDFIGAKELKRRIEYVTAHNNQDYNVETFDITATSALFNPLGVRDSLTFKAKRFDTSKPFYAPIFSNDLEVFGEGMEPPGFTSTTGGCFSTTVGTCGTHRAQISVGNKMSFIRRLSGMAIAGSNFYGVFEENNINDTAHSQFVGNNNSEFANSAFISFAFGSHHACLTNKLENPLIIEVWCGGFNDKKQIASAVTLHLNNVTVYGNPITRSDPPDPSGPDIRQISAGFDHTCALEKMGDVYCWGANTEGQLGHSSGQSSANSAEVKKADNSNLKAVMIESGGNNTCAIERDTLKVFCWGQFSGVLPLAAAGNTHIPTEVSGINQTKSISVGVNVACAIDGQNEVYCWGNNSTGAVGKNPATAGTLITTPSKVLKNGSPLSEIVAISAGESTACALNAYGELYCWGPKNSNLLGLGAAKSAANTGEPYKLSFDYSSDYTASELQNLKSYAATISVGSEHACAVVKSFLSGTGLEPHLFCWGSNTYYQTRFGPGESADAPSWVKALTGHNNKIRLSDCPFRLDLIANSTDMFRP